MAITHLRTPAALLSLVALLAATPRTARGAEVLFTDFESGIPASFSAPGAHLDGVQGWAGLGGISGAFEGSFLRYDAQAVLDTRLTLRDLPPHTRLDLGFLLAVIDSWDGVELFQVLVDETLLFSHSFQLASGDHSSYDPAPPGALLSSGTNLGYSSGFYYGHDRAYDLAAEPALQNIAHTADSVTIVWRLDAVPGGGASFWQGGTDESWALDHVRVTVHGVPGVDVPAAGEPRGLRLHAPAPHPAHAAGFGLSFSLPTDEPATLELFDVSGRRAAEERIASPAPGTQRVELGRASRLSPGIHFARLSQGGRSRTLRIVLTD